MPTYPIQLKRNGTAAATPSSLLHGEVALNYADGKLFWKDASNVIRSFTFQAYAASSHTHAASDITSGTLDAARIANDSITYAKLQNVSATDRLLGRSSAGAGDVEEITCTAFGRSLIDDADAASARTTLSVQPTASPAFTGTVTAAAVTLSGVLLVTTGSASAPGVSFSGDANTGQFSPAADNWAVATGGTERVRVNASGNVGIGISPSTLLHLNSLGVLRLQTGSVTMDCTPTAGATDSFVWNTSANAAYRWSMNGTERVRIESDGKLYAYSTYETTVGGTNRDLFIDSGGLIGYVSSIRASKTNIAAIDDVSWLRDLTPVSFHYRKRNEDGTYSDEPDGTLDYGLIAEDVEQVAPEMCFYDVVDGEPQLRGVHYSKLITPMLRYIQQLEQRIAALEERLNHA